MLLWGNVLRQAGGPRLQNHPSTETLSVRLCEIKFVVKFDKQRKDDRKKKKSVQLSAAAEEMTDILCGESCSKLEINSAEVTWIYNNMCFGTSSGNISGKYLNFGFFGWSSLERHSCHVFVWTSGSKDTKLSGFLAWLLCDSSSSWVAYFLQKLPSAFACQMRVIKCVCVRRKWLRLFWYVGFYSSQLW